MKLIYYFIDMFDVLFSKDYKVISKSKLEKDKKLIAKKICMSYARGNISLKKGNYLTTEDINAKKQEVLKYTFKV